MSRPLPTIAGLLATLVALVLAITWIVSNFEGDDPVAAQQAGAAIAVDITVNGEQADTPPGLEIDAGAALRWSFEVTNTGSVAFDAVTVRIYREEPATATEPPGSSTLVPCRPDEPSFEPGDVWTCMGVTTADVGERVQFVNVIGFIDVARTQELADEGVDVQAETDSERDAAWYVGVEADGGAAPTTTSADAAPTDMTEAADATDTTAPTTTEAADAAPTTAAPTTASATTASTAPESTAEPTATAPTTTAAADADDAGVEAAQVTDTTDPDRLPNTGPTDSLPLGVVGTLVAAAGLGGLWLARRYHWAIPFTHPEGLARRLPSWRERRRR